MQLNPDIAFTAQVNPLTGKDFEHIVAATFFYLGYYVERNIIFSINKATVAEVDVIANLITPLNEIRIAVECKGQNPNFNDLRKFSAIKQLLDNDEYITDLIVYGSNAIRDEHKTVAKLLRIKLLKKEDLSKKVLPILWGTGNVRSDRISWLNRYLTVFKIEDFLLETTISGIGDAVLKKLFTQYYKYLNSDLWSIKNPIDQIVDAFDKAQNEFNGFTDTVANALGRTAHQEVHNPTSHIIQAAMLLELKHRMINLNGIVRCSILARTTQGRDVIQARSPAIREALNELCDYNISVSHFMTFTYRWIFLWGGVLCREGRSSKIELSQIAKESGISFESASKFVQIIYKIYQSGQGLFYYDDNIVFMKYVPAHFRALGLIHRKSVFGAGFARNLFNTDTRNEALLNDSLASQGGIAGLRF